jgi:DNA-binding NarL/FixJ family response regulator
VEKIRVLVADRPRLMRDLVLATISDQPDMEVVEGVAADADLMHATAVHRPDVVIVFAENLDERPGICTEVLASHSHVRILALAPEHNLGAFYWRETEVKIRSMSVESSEQGILGALRGKVQCA